MSQLASASLHLSGWFQALLDVTPHPCCLYDLNCVAALSNELARSRLPPEVANGHRSLWAHYPHLVGRRYWTLFNEARETGLPCEGSEYDEVVRNWYRFWLRPVKDESEQVTHIAVAWENINQQKVIEATISEMRAELDLMVSVSTVIEWSFSPSDMQMTFTKNAQRYIGRSAMPVADFLAGVFPEDRSAFFAGIDDTIKLQGKPHEFSYRFQSPGEAPIVMHSRAAFVPGWIVRPDKVAGVIFVLTEPPTVARSPTEALTGAQIRAARAILGWSVRELAERSGVSVSTIVRSEECDGPVNARSSNQEALRSALIRGGTRLFSDEHGSPAVSKLQHETADEVEVSSVS